MGDFGFDQGCAVLGCFRQSCGYFDPRTLSSSIKMWVGCAGPVLGGAILPG